MQEILCAFTIFVKYSDLVVYLAKFTANLIILLGFCY